MTSWPASLAQHVYRVMGEEFIAPNSKAIFNGQISEEGTLHPLARELREAGLDAGLVRINGPSSARRRL